jgi:hypothetical protein
MSGVISITFGKSRRIPFVVKDALGQVDLTTVATISSSNQAVTRAVIDPENNRKMLVSALAPSPGGANTTVTVTALGHSDSDQVFTAAPPDMTSVTLGTPEDEFDTPA